MYEMPETKINTFHDVTCRSECCIAFANSKNTVWYRIKAPFSPQCLEYDLKPHPCTTLFTKTPFSFHL